MSSDDPGGETMPTTAAGSDSQPDQPPLVRLTARPTLVQIVRPPVSEGNVVATFQRDISDATSGPNNSSVQFILTNNSSSGKNQSNQASTFQCCHCEWTCNTEELLLDHLGSVHLEHRKDASSLQQVSSNLKSSLSQVSNSDNASKRIKPAIISKPKKFPPDALYSLLADSAASLESPGTLTTTITLVKSPSHTSEDNTSYSNASGKAAKNSAKADYVCQFLRCSKRFAKLDQLRQHHRGHFRLKPYQCTWPGCSQDFSRRPAALRHIRTMHQKMPRWKVGELTAETKAEAHKFIRVVNEAVQEEESALDAVRRAKKRILVGQTAATNTQSLSAAAAKSAPISNKASAAAAENDEETNDYESDIEEEEEEEEEEGSNSHGENPESTSADDQNADCQQTEKPRRSYLCQFPRCGKVYQRLYALRMHHRSHSKHQPYYCKYPKADHSQEEEEGSPSPSSAISSSSECGEPFRRRANAVRHILAKHYGVPKADQSALSGPEKARASAFIGEQAQVLAKEEASLESLRVNRPRDPSRPPLKYRCQTCQKFFPAPGKLLVHQRTHSEALKPFFCRWAGCPKQAITERATLLKHILQKHIKGAGGQQTFEKVQQAEELSVINSDNKSATQTSLAATTSAGAFTEAEKAAAAPYVGVHQHLLEQERKTVLKRTEEVLPPAPDTMSSTTTNDSGALMGLRTSHTGEPFNFQSLFSVPMSGPFPPVHFGPVFSVQIAVHKID